ncbi:hypothetical protein EDD15DRAFT_1512611 [Pisolithus albus]|nr:hypothetical protein EDD15DRAFT_1512611 [Pisolithus albus]
MLRSLLSTWLPLRLMPSGTTATVTAPDAADTTPDVSATTSTTAKADSVAAVTATDAAVPMPDASNTNVVIAEAGLAAGVTTPDDAVAPCVMHPTRQLLLGEALHGSLHQVV